MLSDELKQAFIDLVTKCDEARLKYCETHRDAGDAYIHCAVGRDVDMKNVRKKAIEYMVEKLAIEEYTTKRIADQIDEWAIEMMPGSIHECYGSNGRHIVESFAIKEVENSHDVSTIARELDCTDEDFRELVRWAKDIDRTHCIGPLHHDEFETFNTYQVTDACWLATVPDTWFREQLSELNEDNKDFCDMMEDMDE